MPAPGAGRSSSLWDARGEGAGRRAVGAGEAGPRRQEARVVLGGGAEAVRAGRIVAVKGLGGFHLRGRGARRSGPAPARAEAPRGKALCPDVPLAGGRARPCARSPPLEERLLRSPEAPIVLLRRLQASGLTHRTNGLAPSLAPGNPNLGVMLPYTPLHHLLLSLLGFPVVATSGNLSDEPICTDEAEALERLGGIADLFLVHNRPIVRHVDDSIVRVMMGRELVLRRARGYAPLPVVLRPQGRNPKSEMPKSEVEDGSRRERPDRFWAWARI